MSMSLADTMLHTIYVPTAKREGLWKEDGSSGDETSYLESKRQRMLLRSSNLTVAGFPHSLQPFSYFPANFEANRRSSRSQHGDDLKSRNTLGMKQNNTSGSTPREKPDVRSKEDRCAVDQLGKETMTAHQASKNSTEGGEGVTVDLRQGRRDCLHETRGSPPCTKPLKFGIEAILAIGSKPSEKRMVNLSEYTQRILGRAMIPSGANSVQYGHATPKSAGSKHAAVANPSPRSPWNNNSPRPLGHPAGRWECFPGVAEAGRTGWITREHCSEYHDNFQSRHSPYPWTRTSDPTVQHCYPLQPTLPPSHPTLPRSFHQAAAAASAMRSTLVQDIGQDIKSNMGGSGGIVTGNHKRKRSWSRAVFTSLQRKGLEKRFEIQKYVNKPERRQLASALGLSDAQVKVWFQNRRMKWRHTQQFNRPHGLPEGHADDVQQAQQHLDMDNHLDKESDDPNNNGSQTEDCKRSRRAEFGESAFADCDHVDSSDEEIQQ